MNFKLRLKPIHYILLLIILIVCLYQQLVKKSTVIEGYQSYEDCVNQGYPLDFCLQVPVQSYIGS